MGTLNAPKGYGRRPNRLRILWIKANKLLPLHSGGSIRSYNILRQLAVHNDVTLFSYYEGAPDAKYENELTRLFPRAVCLCTGTRFLGRGLDYLLRFPLQPPYAVARFKSAAVRSRIQASLREKRFDVAVCDFLDAAINFPASSDIPAVLFQHNVESEIWRRHVLTAINPARRLIYGVEFMKMLHYEQRAVRRFDHVIAVSGHDRKLMSAWTDASRITIVPTGVDLQQFQPSPSLRTTGKPLVLFVGAMDWEPNIDAAEYFCREIWPSILAKVPTAQFRIVGRDPVRRVQELISRSVEVTGSVTSVVDHLHEAAVVVVPLRVGGGTRLKIYEAMAAGKAVVSTAIGAEGLDVHPGQDIVLADEPVAFADAVITFLQDGELRLRYEQAAASLAARYDWAAIGDKFGSVLESLVSRTIAGADTSAPHTPR